MTEINLIKKAYQKFVDECVIIDGELEIWLKESFTFRVSQSSCTFFHVADYSSRKALAKAINDCLSGELEQITKEAWVKGEVYSERDIVNPNPTSA